MATGAKSLKIKWDSEAARKLVDIWTDILEEYFPVWINLSNALPQ